MKRALSFFLSIVICFTFIVETKQIFSKADRNETSAENKEPTLNAKCAIVMEKSTERILFQKNAFKRTAMASTTKLMTALVTVSSIDITATTTISSKAASIGGSTVGLKKGTSVSIKDLLYCLMLRSGNDAAIALAEAVAGNVEDFCLLMNEKAKQLGAFNTNFTSPHGLDNDEHYTTARDLAVICKAASENIIVKEIMGSKHYDYGNNLLINTNPFLGTYNEVTGGKTGFTNNAGRSIALTAAKNNMDIIIVLIGCDTSKTRLSDGKKLLDYIFGSYEMKTFVEKGDTLCPIINKRNVNGKAFLKSSYTVSVPINIAAKEKITVSVEFESKEYIQGATIYTKKEYKQNLPVGKIILIDEKGNKFYKNDIYIDNDIIEKDFEYCLKKVVVYWFCGML